jgi:uncharacterized membrane protein YozB (DUF420 family)
MTQHWVSWLPHVNASLNLVATVLLVTGYWLIRRHRELAHQRTMIASFVVSILFLCSYLYYHAHHPSTKFPSYPAAPVRLLYFGILISHIVLAATVPFLAIVTIYHGLKDNRRRHKRLARWTFPIWLYVSITGVVVYLMLYQFYPSQP